MQQVLGAFGVFTEAPQQIRLVTPYQDAHEAFRAFLAAAKVSIRFMIYGATYQPFFDELLATRQRGVSVQGIFDHSQTQGRTEKAQIERLVAGGFADGKHFLIDTSLESHETCHIKATWTDGLHVEDGSLNYSLSGSAQIPRVAFSQYPRGPPAWTGCSSRPAILSRATRTF